MPNYNELKHKRSVKNGFVKWVEPEIIKVVNMDEAHAAELNKQFSNTGIKYELKKTKK